MNKTGNTHSHTDAKMKTRQFKATFSGNVVTSVESEFGATEAKKVVEAVEMLNSESEVTVKAEYYWITDEGQYIDFGFQGVEVANIARKWFTLRDGEKTYKARPCREWPEDAAELKIEAVK